MVFADLLNVDRMTISLFDRGEDTVGKGDIVVTILLGWMCMDLYFSASFYPFRFFWTRTSTFMYLDFQNILAVVLLSAM